jgi:hypothetical protein
MIRMVFSNRRVERGWEELTTERTEVTEEKSHFASCSGEPGIIVPPDFVAAVHVLAAQGIVFLLLLASEEASADMLTRFSSPRDRGFFQGYFST